MRNLDDWIDLGFGIVFAAFGVGLLFAGGLMLLQGFGVLTL